MDPPAREDLPRGYFCVPMGEWRSAVRWMVRVSLMATVPGEDSRPWEAAGAFAVAKSAAEDRLIGNRRPRKAPEKQGRPPPLPFGPRLRRLRLRHNEWLHAQVRLAPLLLLVRLRPPQTGEADDRIAAEWLERLDDERCDDPSFMRGSWWRSDLFGDRKCGAPAGFLQPCMGAVVMGDLNAVTAVEHANRRMLLRSGALRLAELPLTGRALSTGACVGDISVDDLIIHIAAVVGASSCGWTSATPRCVGAPNTRYGKSSACPKARPRRRPAPRQSTSWGGVADVGRNSWDFRAPGGAR